MDEPATRERHRHRRHHHHERHGDKLVVRYIVALVKCRSCGYMHSLEYTRDRPISKAEWDARRCEKCGRKLASLGLLGYGLLRLRCVRDRWKRRARRWQRRLHRSGREHLRDDA